MKRSILSILFILSKSLLCALDRSLCDLCVTRLLFFVKKWKFAQINFVSAMSVLSRDEARKELTYEADWHPPWTG